MPTPSNDVTSIDFGRVVEIEDNGVRALFPAHYAVRAIPVVIAVLLIQLMHQI